MSVRAVDAVFAHSKSKHDARLVLFVIAEAARNDGVAWPSQTLIAQRANVSGRSVTRAVRSLEAIGELEIRHLCREHLRLNCYRIVLPGLDPLHVDPPSIEPMTRVGFRLSQPFTTGQVAPPNPPDSRSRPADLSATTRQPGHSSRARDPLGVNRKGNRQETRNEEHRYGVGEKPAEPCERKPNKGDPLEEAKAEAISCLAEAVPEEQRDAKFCLTVHREFGHLLTPEAFLAAGDILRQKLDGGDHIENIGSYANGILGHFAGGYHGDEYVLDQNALRRSREQSAAERHRQPDASGTSLDGFFRLGEAAT